VEGLPSLVQASNARTRGYRFTRNLIAIINLIHGKLPSHQPASSSEDPHSLPRASRSIGHPPVTDALTP
jgi:hypothetical protein